MKVKYLCLWSRRVNIQFLYHRKKKAMSSLMCALMGYLISVGSAPKSWGLGNGSREGSGKSWWPKPAWWTPPAHKDAKSCLFMETAQVTDGLWKLTQKHSQENLLRFLGAVLWLLFFPSGRWWRSPYTTIGIRRNAFLLSLETHYKS